MKSLINNIYIFSKLSVILILLLALFSMAYIFYQSYAKIEISSNKTNKEGKIVVDLISDNSDKIEKLNNIIKEVSDNLININNIFNSEENNKQDISNEAKAIFRDIKNEINILRSDILRVENELKNIQEPIPDLVDNNLSLKNDNEIINLMKIKFEEGKNFSAEIDLLNQIRGAKIQHLIEKLYILNDQSFKGNAMLSLEFQLESNDYISKVFFNENKIIKTFLPYINIKPSQINVLKTKELININNINDLIDNKKYEKSANLLKFIDDENKYFNKTLDQLNIGKKFYSTIEEIIKNG